MRKEVKGLTHPIELFSKSVEAVRSNLAIFVVLYILPAIFILGGRNPNAKSTLGNNGITLSAGAIAAIIISAGIASIAAILIAAFYQAILYSAQLEAAQGSVSYKSIWTSATRYWLRLFLLFICMGVAIIAGLILFIVPGLIFIRRYFLAPYFMIDQDLGVMESLRRSSAASKPISSYIWGVIGLMVLFSLPGAFSNVGGLVSLALAVAFSVAPALLYLEAKKIVKI